jgi:hypothetical protein
MGAQMVQELLKDILGPLGTLEAIECAGGPDIHDLEDEAVWPVGYLGYA